MLKEEILKLIEKHGAFSTRDIYEAFDEKYTFNHLGVVLKKLVVKSRLSQFKTKFLSSSYIYGMSMRDCMNYLRKRNLIPAFIKLFLKQIYQKGFTTNLELKTLGLTKFHLKIIEKLFAKNNQIVQIYNYNSEVKVYVPTGIRTPQILASIAFKEQIKKYCRKKKNNNEIGRRMEEEVAEMLRKQGWQIVLHKYFKCNGFTRVVDIFGVKDLGLGFKTFLFCEVKANNSILTLWDIKTLEKIRQVLFNGNGFIVGFSANRKISYSVFKLLPKRSAIIYNMKKLKKMGIG